MKNPFTVFSLSKLINRAMDNVPMEKGVNFDDHEFFLSVKYRPEVVSRRWYVIGWTDSGGKRRMVSGQTLEIAMRRMAEDELQAEEQELAR